MDSGKADESVALRLQRLRNARSKVLVVAQLCGLQNGDGWFEQTSLQSLFETLRVPAPKNLSREMRALVSAGFVVTREASPRHSLTPEGHSEVNLLFGRTSLDDLKLAENSSFGADFGSARHLLVPPSLAPARWQPAIDQMLETFPFERNVFCMTRFSEGAEDPIDCAIDELRGSLSERGLVLHLASDRQLDDELYANIAAHMWACRFGIAVFEDLASPRRGVNANLLIEVGAMLSLGRRTALLKDRSIDVLPSDLVGHIYKPVDIQTTGSVGAAVGDWVENDLG